MFAVCAGFVGPSPFDLANQQLSPVPAHNGKPPCQASNRRLLRRSKSSSNPFQDACSVSCVGGANSSSPSAQVETARHVETILIEACDLLRRCCPCIPLPVHPPESVLKIAFGNEGMLLPSLLFYIPRSTYMNSVANILYILEKNESPKKPLR